MSDVAFYGNAITRVEYVDKKPGKDGRFYVRLEGEPCDITLWVSVEIAEVLRPLSSRKD